MEEEEVSKIDNSTDVNTSKRGVEYMREYIREYTREYIRKCMKIRNLL